MYRCTGFSIFPQVGSFVVLVRVSFEIKYLLEKKFQTEILTRMISKVFLEHIDILLFLTQFCFYFHRGFVNDTGNFGTFI